MRHWTWFAVGSLGCTALFAQPRTVPADSLPVATSLLAGFVTHAEGDVIVDGTLVDVESGKLYQIEDGERAIINDGRAEFTLCIGSYLRLGKRSEIEMVNAGMRSAEVRLVRGELLADVPFLVDEQVSTLYAGDLTLKLSRPGLYRVTADGGEVRVDVLRGRADVAWASGEAKLGKGRSIRHASGREPSWDKAEDAKQAELVAWNRKRQQAWQDHSQERWEGMSPLERMMLDMTMRRPTPPPAMTGSHGGAGRNTSPGGAKP